MGTDFGHWEGLSFTEVEAFHFRKDAFAQPDAFRPGGESVVELRPGLLRLRIIQESGGYND